MSEMLTPNQVIQRIADVAEAVGWHAGVGGCETAGAIISYLSLHPDETGQFLADGILALPDDLWGSGRLTFHRKSDNAVTTPQDLREARIVCDLTRSK